MGLSIKTTRKKKTRAPRIKVNKSQNPKWEGWEEWTGEQFHRHKTHARDWYYSNFKAVDLSAHLYRWMLEQEEYTKNDVQAIKALPNHRVSSTVSISAKLLLDGGLDKDISSEVSDLSLKMGEKLVIDTVKELEGVNLGVYVHSNNKLGAVVSLEGTDSSSTNENDQLESLRNCLQKYPWDKKAIFIDAPITTSSQRQVSRGHIIFGPGKTQADQQAAADKVWLLCKESGWETLRICNKNHLH